MTIPSSHLENKPKIYFTHGVLPKYVDETQLPSRDKPWGAIFQQRWASSVDLILEDSLYEKISEQVLSKLSNALWSRINMPLSAVLQGEFFDTYLKRGNISMLSAGRPGLDTIYTIQEGILRLELPKELYERAGLVGRAIPDGGRKHIRTRFAVELNLREPSMMRGKRGFERLMRAANTVLKEPVVWLFNDHWPSQTLQSGVAPITAYSPERHDLVPTVTRLENISVPDMRDWDQEPSRTTEDAVDLLDWLGMVAIASPRLSRADSIDKFLARYQVPEQERASQASVVRLRWSGFIQAEWIRQVLLQCMIATRTMPSAWYSISVRTLFRDSHEPRDGYTILRTNSSSLDSETKNPLGSEFLMWEMASAIVE